MRFFTATGSDSSASISQGEPGGGRPGTVESGLRKQRSVETLTTQCSRSEVTDWLVWTNPTTGKEMELASAFEDHDRLVVLKQYRSDMSCRVDQMRRDNQAALAARN